LGSAVHMKDGHFKAKERVTLRESVRTKKAGKGTTKKRGVANWAERNGGEEGRAVRKS